MTNESYDKLLCAYAANTTIYVTDGRDGKQHPLPNLKCLYTTLEACVH